MDTRFEELLQSSIPWMENIVSSAVGLPVQSSQRLRQVVPITQPQGTHKIPIDMLVDEKTITIYADLPGVNIENVEIDIFNDKLTLTAKRTKDYTPGPNNACELLSGNFERVIKLNFCITRKETVKASMKNGILKIRINKLLEEENKFSVKPSEE